MDQGVLAQLTQLYMTMKLECPFYRVCIYASCTFKPTCQVKKKVPLILGLLFLYDCLGSTVFTQAAGEVIFVSWVYTGKSSGPSSL